LSSSSSRAALVLVVVAALAASGCGGDKGGRRKAVDDYIQQANDLQSRYARSITRANRAYRSFSAGRPSPAELKRLGEAQSSILALRVQLQQLHPPADARKLHNDLLAFVHLEQGIALEVTEFEQFVPQVGRVLADLGTLNTAFRLNFARATTAADQQRVFGDYASALGKTAARLERLGAPPALAPWQQAEVARLRKTAAAAVGLRAALIARDRAGVQRQVAAFSSAASETRAENEAQRVAIKAYNRRLTNIARAAAKIERDRQVLQNQLG
jgi:hypothetical protein